MGRNGSAATLTPLLAVAVATLVPGATRASWLEPLLMPGPVAAAHASFEKECTKCHRPFDKAAQDSLCLDCHVEVRRDRAESTGYHGRSPQPRTQRCEACHEEHRGRDTRLITLDRGSFDHSATDAPLQGRHHDVACEQCHPEGRRFRDAPADCASCHAGADPHAASLQGACDLCHVTDGWSEVRFDHDTAAFPLRGEHRRAPCAGCHASRRFRPTPQDCHSCHADVRHRGTLGNDCQSCHTPEVWKIAFDHARRTRFALLGRHAAVACEACHTPARAPRDTPRECGSCHADDDAHGGRFGKRCQDCHTPSAWERATFDHARDTKFPLRGKHVAVDCRRCHRAPVARERPASNCYACHRDDDVHRGREGNRCQNCHDERAWSRGVLFDHATTRFPLDGAHARVACTTCHLSSRFDDVRNRCFSCHERRDVHRGAEGPRCERCHDAVSWKHTHEPQ